MSSSSKSKIYFFFKTPVSLRNRTSLKTFIHTIFKKEKRKLQSLNYVFCSDEDLLQINRQYLQHDFYTDIISFELSPKGSPVEGEIYISIDRVKDNARELHQPFYAELHRVIFHGALHLCGYKDKQKSEIKKMREMETNYLKKYLKVSRDTVST
jgi:rRNA maturation RNase YbeY